MADEEGKDSPPLKKKCYRKKVERVWNDTDVIKLIAAVEERPMLWDAGHPDYKLQKDLIWQELADSLNSSVNDCKGKWTNLRTSFCYNLEKLRKKKSGQGAAENFKVTWKHFQSLMFLEASKVKQSSESTTSMPLDSPNTDMKFLESIKEVTECKQQIEKSASKQKKEKNLELKEMAVNALQNLQTQKGPNSTLGQYIASELDCLSPEVAAFVRSKLRRAFNDIMDQVHVHHYSPVPNTDDDLVEEEN